MAGTHWVWIVPKNGHRYDTLAHLMTIPPDPIVFYTLCGQWVKRYAIVGRSWTAPPPTQRRMCPMCSEVWVKYVYNGWLTREDLPTPP